MEGKNMKSIFLKFQQIYRFFSNQKSNFFRLSVFALMLTFTIGLLYKVGSIENNSQSTMLTIPDSTIFSKPDVKINVNKEYDNNGNISKYDSSYSWSYSSSGNAVNIDSLMKSFNLSFGGNLPDDFWGFDNPMFSQKSDSSLLNFSGDSSTDLMEQQMNQMRKMMEQMNQSMFNQFPMQSPAPKQNNHNEGTDL